MGLQIWLPLNGNLENKGLLNSTIQSNNITVDNSGKLSTCYNFNGTDSFISLTDIYNIFKGDNNPFSITMWIYSSDSNDRSVLFGDYGLNGSGNTNLEKRTDGKIRFYWGNGVPDLIFNSILNNNEWVHLGLTYNGQKICLYINGQLSDSKQVTLSSLNKTSGLFYIGRDARTGTTALNGKINDFRLYDEALSPMQIKLISQGLVAHYLLNNNGSGNNNLALNSHNLNIIATKDNKNISHRGTSVVQLREDGFYEVKVTKSFGGIDIYANSLNLQVGDKITFSFYTYINGSFKTISFYPMMYDSSGTRDTSSHLPISVDGGTYTTVNSKSIGQISNIIPQRHYITFEWNSAMKNILDNGGKIELSIQIHGTWQDGDYGCIFAPKLEYGDKPTPWCPNSEDALATQLGYNDNTEYDVSGYCHNGIKYNITDYTSDTPRYSVATKFETNAYINIGRGGMVRDEITVNIWGYMDDWTKYNSRLISCTEDGGWSFTAPSGKIHFVVGTGSTSNAYKTTSGYTLSELSSGWHMFTGTYDGLVVKQYIDGVLNTTNNAYTTKTPIFYHTSNPVLIGAEASSTQNPAGNYFNGYLSDVRIYATALSESDIQSLYKNSAFLDSSGNVYATEYVES